MKKRMQKRLEKDTAYICNVRATQLITGRIPFMDSLRLDLIYFKYKFVYPVTLSMINYIKLFIYYCKAIGFVWHELMHIIFILPFYFFVDINFKITALIIDLNPKNFKNKGNMQMFMQITQETPKSVIDTSLLSYICIFISSIAPLFGLFGFYYLVFTFNIHSFIEYFCFIVCCIGSSSLFPSPADLNTAKIGLTGIIYKLSKIF